MHYERGQIWEKKLSPHMNEFTFYRRDDSKERWRYILYVRRYEERPRSSDKYSCAGNEKCSRLQPSSHEYTWNGGTGEPVCLAFVVGLAVGIWAFRPSFGQTSWSFLSLEALRTLPALGMPWIEQAAFREKVSWLRHLALCIPTHFSRGSKSKLFIYSVHFLLLSRKTDIHRQLAGKI